MVELHEVRKHYASPGGVVRAVDGVSLAVRGGEVAAIFGPSGSGKTTLLFLASGLLEPDSGTVTVCGTDLATLTRPRALLLRQQEIGFVYQMFNLMPGLDAVENVMVPRLIAKVPGRVAEAEANELLGLVGLGERMHHRAIHLSGGEQQRVAIAGALAGNPSVVFADEPTGNLDSHTGAHVLTLLRSLAKERGTAVVLVTHDRDALAYADRAVTLRDGKIVGEEVTGQAQEATQTHA